jgi:hypothetical protein
MPGSYNYSKKPTHPRVRDERRGFSSRSPHHWNHGGRFTTGQSSGNLGLIIAFFGVTIFSLLAIFVILIYSVTMGSS